MSKDTQIIIRASEKQKQFLSQQALKEDRTVTTLINMALGAQYPEYQKITKEYKDEMARNNAKRESQEK